jgi:hypothetical protein
MIRNQREYQYTVERIADFEAQASAARQRLLEEGYTEHDAERAVTRAFRRTSKAADRPTGLPASSARAGVAASHLACYRPSGRAMITGGRERLRLAVATTPGHDPPSLEELLEVAGVDATEPTTTGARAVCRSAE